MIDESRRQEVSTLQIRSSKFQLINTYEFNFIRN